MSFLSQFRWWLIPEEVKQRLFEAEFRAKEYPIKSMPELLMAEEVARASREHLQELVSEQAERLSKQTVTITEKKLRIDTLESELKSYEDFWDFVRKKLKGDYPVSNNPGGNPWGS